MFGKSSSSDRIKEPELLVGLDLGTSKISVIVAEKDADYDEPQIIAVDSVPSDGIRKGSIINIELASKAIKHAVSVAETRVGKMPKKAAVAFSCGDEMTCVTTSGKLVLGVNPRPVMEEDIERVMQLAKEDLAVPSNKTIIHTIPVKYCLDDAEMENPVTMTGKTLKIELETVMVPTNIIQNIISCLQKADVEVQELILKPLASSLSVVTRDEAQNGSVVLDIGGGTTGITVYSKGHPVYMSMIPIGGDHITNDIATILKVPLVNAEEIKRKVIFCEDEDEYFDKDVEFICNNRTYTVPRSEVIEIISCRLEELCKELLIPKIAESGISSIAGGIILTGGVSKTSGIDVLMRDIFNLPVRIAFPSESAAMTPGKNDQEYSAVAGIIKYVTEKQGNPYRFMDTLPGFAAANKSENGKQSSVAGELKSKITKPWTETKEIAPKVKDETKKIGSKVADLFKDLF